MRLGLRIRKDPSKHVRVASPNDRSIIAARQTVSNVVEGEYSPGKDLRHRRGQLQERAPNPRYLELATSKMRIQKDSGLGGKP